MTPAEKGGDGSEGGRSGVRERREKAAAAARTEDFQADEGLFVKLKELRSRLAREAGVPAYIVFSDASLRDMCRKRPQNQGQFLNVAGVGAVKLEKFGALFMAAIREYGGASVAAMDGDAGYHRGTRRPV
ncbi:MAG: HRDC domain-containing protein [Treponema sp.]|nr:HRDC domain-containing protein [Treponema sp.]